MRAHTRARTHTHTHRLTHTLTELYKQKEGCCVPGLKVSVTFYFHYTAELQSMNQVEENIFYSTFTPYKHVSCDGSKSRCFYHLTVNWYYGKQSRAQVSLYKRNLSMCEINISPPSGE